MTTTQDLFNDIVLRWRRPRREQASDEGGEHLELRSTAGTPLRIVLAKFRDEPRPIAFPHLDELALPILGVDRNDIQCGTLAVVSTPNHSAVRPIHHSDQTIPHQAQPLPFQPPKSKPVKQLHPRAPRRPLFARTSSSASPRTSSWARSAPTTAHTGSNAEFARGLRNVPVRIPSGFLAPLQLSAADARGAASSEKLNT